MAEIVGTSQMVYRIVDNWTAWEKALGREQADSRLDAFLEKAPAWKTTVKRIMSSEHDRAAS